MGRPVSTNKVYATYLISCALLYGIFVWGLKEIFPPNIPVGLVYLIYTFPFLPFLLFFLLLWQSLQKYNLNGVDDENARGYITPKKARFTDEEEVRDSASGIPCTVVVLAESTSNDNSVCIEDVLFDTLPVVSEGRENLVLTSKISPSNKIIIARVCNVYQTSHGTESGTKYIVEVFSVGKENTKILVEEFGWKQFESNPFS